MSKRPTILFLLAALAVAWGCGDKPAVKKPDGDIKTGVEDATASNAVPEGLRTAAYEYLGLGNPAVMTYDVAYAGMEASDGTQVTTLEEVVDGVASFRIARTGALAQLGVDKVELRADGAYTVASSMGEMKSPSLVLPADVAAGSNWTTRMDMDNLQGGQQKVESEVQNRAVGMETVETPAGKYECLVVESVINAKTSGSPDPNLNGDSVTNFKTYYAKGVGIVKLTGTTTVKKTNEKKDVNIVLKAVAETKDTAN
jgi:hypothetical protein